LKIKKHRKHLSLSLSDQNWVFKRRRRLFLCICLRLQLKSLALMKCQVIMFMLKHIISDTTHATYLLSSSHKDTYLIEGRGGGGGGRGIIKLPERIRDFDFQFFGGSLTELNSDQRFVFHHSPLFSFFFLLFFLHFLILCVCVSFFYLSLF
jgi:hypothetical protein